LEKFMRGEARQRKVTHDEDDDVRRIVPMARTKFVLFSVWFTLLNPGATRGELSFPDGESLGGVAARLPVGQP
jgi:hypothetical protein